MLTKNKKISAKGKTPMTIKEVILDNFDISFTFNKFSVNIVPNLYILRRKNLKSILVQLMIHF